MCNQTIFDYLDERAREGREVGQFYIGEYLLKFSHWSRPLLYKISDFDHNPIPEPVARW